MVVQIGADGTAADIVLLRRWYGEALALARAHPGNWPAQQRAENLRRRIAAFEGNPAAAAAPGGAIGAAPVALLGLAAVAAIVVLVVLRR